jgi:hypothetical protein
MSSEFATKENVDTLWEVIVDTIQTNPNNLGQIRNSFNEQLHLFYEREKISTSQIDLFQLNKQFVSVFIQKQQQQQHHQQKYTAEAIQSDRKTAFDKDLNARRSEFERSLAPPPPDTPKFNDPVDKPINGMAELVAKALAERNYDTLERPKPSTTQSNSIKYIKIGGEINANNDVIVLPNLQLQSQQSLHQSYQRPNSPPQQIKKTLSWSSDLTNNDSIFSKLKFKQVNDEFEEITLESLNTKLDDITILLQQLLQNYNR